MDNEPENHTLALLREIRANQDKMNTELNARMDGMNAEQNARMDGMMTQVAGAFRMFSERFDSVDERFDSVDERLELLRSEITLTHSAVVSNNLLIEDHGKRIARLEDDRGSELDRPTTEPH